MGTDQPTLAHLVRRHRESAGLTQAELAERIGKSQRWVSAVESGEVKFPRRATLERMVFPLRVGFTDLLIAAGYAETVADARRVAAAPARKDRTMGDRLDAVYDDLTTGERASIEAIVKSAERNRKRS